MRLKYEEKNALEWGLLGVLRWDGLEAMHEWAQKYKIF